MHRFRYTGFSIDTEGADLVLRCGYALDDTEFEEVVTFNDAPPVAERADAVRAAARLVHLLAGVSYYKAGAPPVIEVDGGLTGEERRLLRAVYVDGMGEFAFENGLDLSDVRIEAGDRPSLTPAPPAAPSQPRRALIPFGGGLDSIVTVEGVRSMTDDPALFVVSREGDRFEAIETPAAVSGLPVVRAERRLDPKILRSRELGYLNGHVPVTGILSAIAVTAAVIHDRDAVVMSNEHSASAGNFERGGRMVNHQWSKSLEFEDLFRDVLATSLPRPVDYHSWLRPFSELWVAERFVDLERYHLAFRSCNRSFHIDPATRLDHWCGECDKCCFIDLILSPFLSRSRLEAVFGGNEPLGDDRLIAQFRALLGLSDVKPFECVGDVDECRIAVLLAADRADRKDDDLLHRLRDEVRSVSTIDVTGEARRQLEPLGAHRIPDSHAPPDLLD